MSKKSSKCIIASCTTGWKKRLFYGAREIKILLRFWHLLEKWMRLIYHSPHGKFLKAGNSQNRLCWNRTTSQVAGSYVCLPSPKQWKYHEESVQIMAFFFGLNYIMIFEQLKRCVLVASTQKWRPIENILLGPYPFNMFGRNIFMSWSDLNIVRMRGKVSN